MDMNYQITLNEREVELILNSLANGENFDIMEPSEIKHNDDYTINLNFENLPEYDNAYLTKIQKLDEEKNHDKLNCETHIKQFENNRNWINGYENSNYGFLSIS